MKTFNKQGGFTLVEVTTVLVIGGLILGGAMKGQELIETGRIRHAVAQLNSIAVAYNAYVERYQALPGDDGTATQLQARGNAWTSATAGDRSGVIDGPAINLTFAPAVNAPAVGDGSVTPAVVDPETVTFFKHLRRAGFLTGDGTSTDVAVLPMNAWGGRTAIVNAASVQRRASTGKQLMVCVSNVPGQAALSMDKQLDDGLTESGSLRATLSTGVASGTPPGTDSTVAAIGAYVDGQVYTLCRNL